MAKKDVIFLSPKSSVAEAIQLFSHFSISHCPVVERGKLVGMITKTNILDFVNNAVHANDNTPVTTFLESVKVNLIMHTEVMQLPVQTEMGKILQAMDGNEVGSVILTDNEKIKGIITETDIVRFMRRELAKEIAVQDQDPGLIDRLSLWLYENGVVSVSKFLGDIGI